MQMLRQSIVRASIVVVAGALAALNLVSAVLLGNPPRVTVSDLTLYPERWNGRTVELTGYMIYLDEFESPILVWNSEEDAMQNHASKHIRLHTFVSPPRIKRKNPIAHRGYTRIIGIFRADTGDANHAFDDLTDITQMLKY